MGPGTLRVDAVGQDQDWRTKFLAPLPGPYDHWNDLLEAERSRISLEGNQHLARRKKGIQSSARQSSLRNECSVQTGTSGLS